MRQGELIDWCFELLADPDAGLTFGEFLLLRIEPLLRVNDLPEDAKWPAPKFAAQLLKAFQPIVLKNHQTREDLVVRTFNLFTECVKDAKEMILEVSLIKLASVLSIAHIGTPKVVFQLLEFLWICARNELVQEMIGIPLVLRNVLTVLDKYVKNQPIVELCVGLAFEMRYPKRLEQVVAAAKSYPSSGFLKKILERDECVAFIKQAIDSTT
jgi:hypothetical protein